MNLLKKEAKMIEKLKAKDFDKMFDLMEKSFPPDELRTYEEEKALLKIPEYGAYVLSESDDKILGFITMWQFSEFSYIDHFAVNPDARNGGIGTKILSEAVKILGKTVCLEVELPETELAERRIGFYRRNGFHLNEFRYIQPPISKGRNPIPLLIMTTGNVITKEQFSKIRSELYVKVYGVNPDCEI